VKSAYDLESLKKFRINPAKLGCVMLNLEPIPVGEWMQADWEYVSPNPEHDWIKGYNVKSHITLKYGFIFSAQQFPGAIDEALEGWDWSTLKLEIDYIDVFDSSFADEPYKCLVAKVIVSDELLEVNQRLSMLPHLDTYPYVPHATLAYVYEQYVEEARDVLNMNAFDLIPTGLDYGK
jgi:2'-5' RNA ligase